MRPFEVLDHTADLGVRAYGRTLKEVFENAAVGMFSQITDLRKVKIKDAVKIDVTAEDRESLLVEWLNELLYRLEVDRWFFKRFNIVEWDESTWLKAMAYGEELDLGRHDVRAQIKACTYHALKVERNSTWHAQVIFDV